MLKQALLATLSLSIALPAMATDMGRISKRGQKAAAIINRMVESENNPDSAIPASLLNQAKCITVFPSMFKAALGPFSFGLGGARGKGLASCRDTEGKWGAPAYVNVSAASLGLQFGIQKIDMVLVYVGDDSMNELVHRNLSANLEAAATAGPIGRSATLGTSINFETGVYSYSHSRGLFAGVAIGGVTMSADKKANKAVYGEESSPEQILVKKASEAPDAASDFLLALESKATEIDDSDDDKN